MVLDFDVILEEIGDYGRYQKFVVYLLSIPACFMNAFAFAFVFLGYTPDFICIPDQKNQSYFPSANWSDPSLIRACTIKTDQDLERGVLGNSSLSECTNFEYDQTYFKSTIVTEWNLVCDHAIHPKTMMSIHSLVTIVACLVNSYFQDLWGRKRTFFIVLTANLIGGISSVFAPNFLIYAILRSFNAYSNTSTWNVSYTWALEYVGPSKRTMVTMVMCVLYGIAAVLVGGMAYLCDTWTKLTLAGTVPFLLLYSFVFLLDESPRWLISQGRNEEALKTVRKMARWEKKTLKEETVQKLLKNSDGDAENEEKLTVLTKTETNEQKSGTGDKISRRPRIQDLFLTRNLRWKTCLITYCWAANLLTYLAIAFNMENLKANFFVTYSLQAAIEIPAGLILIFLLDRFGRIPSLSVSMMACGLLLFATVPIDALDLNPWVIVSMTLAAKFAITTSFGVVVQLAGESYPTQLRGVGTGFSSFMGTLGATVMPYVIHSAKLYKMLPVIILGVTAFSSGFSILMLPETMGRCMPETIAEAERGESVGLAALKENWRKMQCFGRKAYRAVERTETRNGIIEKENEEL